jgi:hypothetical protein
MGIIDFLQKYNARKRMETKWLKLRNRNVDPTTFSCVDPELYGDRFLEFMKHNLFANKLRDSAFSVHSVKNHFEIEETPKSRK